MLSNLRTRIPDKNIWFVYLTILVLSIAYGLAIALTPEVLAHRELTEGQVGQLASWFGFGIVSFAIPSGAIIRRFSARNTLAVCILGYALMIGLFPFLHDYPTIAACRYLDGAFSVGAWVSCETLLLWRSKQDSKAFVTSLYAIATAMGYVIGPVGAFLVSDTLTPDQLFVVAGCIAACASVIGRVLLEADPVLPEDAATHHEGSAHTLTKTDWAGLAWRIKTSSAATFVTGFFQASAVLFLPRYMHVVKHVPEEQTRLVVAFSAAGMLVFSNIAGRIGDKRGHLLVMRTLATVGVIGMIAFIPLPSFWMMAVVMFFAGGSLASMPPLSLALQGVIAKPSEYAQSNSIFNVFFATGLLLGPLLSGLAFEQWGGEKILYLFAALWGAFVLVSWVFRRDDPKHAEHARTRTDSNVLR
jgi:MFS family permease